MSREISFRVWNGKAMEYGGFSIHATGGLMKDSVLGDFLSDAPVMQFTGLKDMNGMDLFEDDIIQNTKGRVCRVSWFNSAGCWDAVFLHDREIVERSSNLSMGFRPNEWDRHVIRIGNIHSRPELLT